MGLTFSCPKYEALDHRLDALMKSLSVGNDYVKSSLRSVSFNGRQSEPVIKAWGSGKLVTKTFLSFNTRDKEPFHVDSRPPLASPSCPSPKEEPASCQSPQEEPARPVTLKCLRFAPIPEEISRSDSPKHEAALKLQKVYKSFRTRRQLADCAVLVEQRWWKLLDFAMLKRSSVSFFEVDKTESAMSKWTRAKSRAAKVGKGISKDVKARKLALQHWLEAIDPRHRYGHNLHFYYDRWLNCDSKQPFFYWLDIGDGREISIDEKCPRSKLHSQCIKYLGPQEREVYEVIIQEGKMVYKKSGQHLHTTTDSKDSKFIFVLSTSKNLYVGQKKKGIFQHSSFLAGGATSAAGRLEVDSGILKAIWPHSGHYCPTEENFLEFVTFLENQNVDLTDVKKSPLEEDEETFSQLRVSRSARDLTRLVIEVTEEQTSTTSNLPRIKSRKRFMSFDATTPTAKAKAEAENDLTNDLEESEEEEEKQGTEIGSDTSFNTEDDGRKKALNVLKGFRKPNLFVDEEEEQEAKVPSELILRRMKFKRETLSLQLGKQLTCKWTTGAGPRIGCVRDFPSELTFQALQQVRLSPRCGRGSKAWSSSGNSPSPIRRASVQKSPFSALEASPLGLINRCNNDR